jgi:hypothetical protein
VSRHAQPISICRDDREHSPSSSPGSQSSVMVDSPSGMTPSHTDTSPQHQTNINQGYYFSFPSFEEWNSDKQEDIDKDSDD